MSPALFHFLAGTVLLYFGGELLVRGAVGLSASLGMRPLVAGLTIVAVGTSAPELVVTLDAALEGYNDVAVGNILGSNLCNIGLILGVAALIRPIRVDPHLLRVDLPINRFRPSIPWLHLLRRRPVQHPLQVQSPRYIIY